MFVVCDGFSADDDPASYFAQFLKPYIVNLLSLLLSAINDVRIIYIHVIRSCCPPSPTQTLNTEMMLEEGLERERGLQRQLDQAYAASAKVELELASMHARARS